MEESFNLMVLASDLEVGTLAAWHAELALRGAKLYRASGLDEALEQVALESLDLCLLEVAPGGDDPLAVLRQLRSTWLDVRARPGTFRELPIVVVLAPGTPDQDSASLTQQELESEALEAGAWETITSDELGTLRTLRMLLRAVEIGRLRQALRCANSLSRTLRRQSTHDQLTGLPNRSHFISLLDATLKVPPAELQRGAVAFVDLDAFSQINETLSHGAGDDMLRQVAQRLSAALHTTDQVARMGGDEFALLLHGLKDEAALARVSDKLMQVFKEPFLYEGVDLYLTASVGVAAFPDHGNELDGLLRNADLALLRAKSFGRNHLCRFSKHLVTDNSQRMHLERKLRRALDGGELEMFYQPQLDLGTGRIVGFEALMRWPDGAGGYIPPTSFIPLAEEVGLITRLGQFALEQSCQQVARWRAQGHRGIYVGVNVSVLQLELEDFSLRVARTLERFQVSPDDLEIELTESVIIQNEDAALDQLARIRRQGVRVAIDDFGSGYAGLVYLRKLPVSSLKIDRSYIQGLGREGNSHSLVESMLGMARGLRLKVVAEGVERDDQLQVLRQLGCERGQGYLFARPMPALEADKLLLEHCPTFWGDVPPATNWI